MVRPTMTQPIGIRVLGAPGHHFTDFQVVLVPAQDLAHEIELHFSSRSGKLKVFLKNAGTHLYHDHCFDGAASVFLQPLYPGGDPSGRGLQYGHGAFSL
jgi:hypothetical protein